VTFVFHGLGGSEAAAKALGLQRAPGASSDSLFVFPRGADFENAGVGWDDRCSGRDMIFFDNMLATIAAAYCVDLNRVFVAGASWGCDFATALACCRGSLIRAVGAASCSDEFSDPADYRTYANYPCASGGVTAFRFTHDASAKGDGVYSGAQFAATRRLYQELAGCGGLPVASAPAPCVAYEGCARTFVECAYENLGHALPASWARDTWEFFAGMR
jgi:poly(3-hydroxybutyrate) depolymerase